MSVGAFCFFRSTMALVGDGSGPSPDEVALGTALASTRGDLQRNIAEMERGGGPPADAPPAAPPPPPAAPPSPVAAPPPPSPAVAPAVAPPAPVVAPPAGTPPPAAAPAPAVAAPVVPPAAPVPEVKVPTQEEIATWRDGYIKGTLSNSRTGLAHDAEAQGWVDQYAAGTARLAALGADLVERGEGEIAKIERELMELEGVLKLDAVKNDDYERNLKLDQQRALRSDLSLKLSERDRLESKQERLGKNYDARVAKYAREADGRINAHLDGLEAPARILAHAAATSALWEPAFSRVALAEGLNQDLIPEFTDYAKMLGGLEVDRTGAPIADDQMDTFLKNAAVRFKGMVDKHHRAQAADYARTAAERAAQPAPLAVPAGSPPAALPPQADPNPLTAVYAEARRNLASFRSA